MPLWTTFVAGPLRECLTGLADLFLPNVCAACAAADVAEGGLCAACNVELLSLVSLPYCPRCATTLGPNIPAGDDGCEACQTVMPRFARAVRLGPFTGPLKTTLHELKYRRQDIMRRRLGRLLGQAVASQCPDGAFDLVLAIPMHWRRRLTRGCDHACMLADSVARILDLPVGNELIRIRNTPSQVGLPRTRRIENVRGAFAVRCPAGIKDTKVLLVDDVTTTGATADEATRALLNAGALRVVLAVVAKAEPPTAYAVHLQA